MIAAGIILAILLNFGLGFLAGSLLTSCKPQPCVQTINPDNYHQLQRDYQQALTDKKAVEQRANAAELRATVYASILNKWRLPVPTAEQIQQFDINKKYFCETWCPWYRDDLPKVKKDYQDSDCPRCTQPRQRSTRTRTCTDCDPPPPRCTGPNCNPPPPPACTGPNCKPPPPPPSSEDDGPTTDYITGTPAPGPDASGPAPGGGTNVITYPVDP